MSEVVWLGTFGALVIAAVRARHHTPPRERSSSETDPLCTTGVTLKVTSAALVILSGPAVFEMMVF